MMTHPITGRIRTALMVLSCLVVAPRFTKGLFVKGRVSTMLAATALLMGACRDSALNAQKAEALKAVAGANNALAVSLYRQFDARKGNLVFSPVSVYGALGMACAGARGETSNEMAAVLQFHLPESLLHSAFHELLRRFAHADGRNGTRLLFASSLWLQNRYQFRNAFLQLIKRNYEAEAHRVNFADAARAADDINQWVGRKTGGRISGLVGSEQIPPETRLVLCNAIYFDGLWRNRFNKKKTKPSSFHVSTNRIVKVPFMFQSAKFKAIFSGVPCPLQLLELPYSGGDLSMVILLPSAPGSLSVLEHRLTATNLSVCLGRLDHTQPRNVAVLLPKFKLQSGFDLRAALASLGMSRAFDTKADFSGIDGTTNLFIADIIHQAVLQINEAGTKAAAGTVAGFSKGIPETFQFRADHPFLFLVRDNSTGCILFIGRVINPLEH